MSRLTGGQVYKYTYFNRDIDAERMLADLSNNLSRPVAFDAIMRVRTSTGTRYVKFINGSSHFLGSDVLSAVFDTFLAWGKADVKGHRGNQH